MGLDGKQTNFDQLSVTDILAEYFVSMSRILVARNETGDFTSEGIGINQEGIKSKRQPTFFRNNKSQLAYALMFLES